MAEAKRASRFLGRVASIEDAMKAIKDPSTAFLVIAGLQMVLLVLILKQYAVLFDVVVLVVCAVLLRRFKSRAAAVVLLVVTLLEAAVTVANRLGVSQLGGNNVVLALIMLWAAVRAAEATFKYRKFGAVAASNSLVRT